MILAGLLGPRVALAWPADFPLSECQCGDLLHPVSPYQEAPLNGRFLRHHPTAEGPLTLALGTREQPGAPVPIQIEEVGDLAGHVWVVPEQDLAPDTDYILTQSPDSISIHTGTTRDTEPPTIGAVSLSSEGFSGACGVQIAATISVTRLRDNHTRPPILRAEISGPTGPTVVLLLPQHASDRSHYVVFGRVPGLGDCGNFPGAQVGESHIVQLRAIDRAGNVSAPTAPLPFRFQPSLDYTLDRMVQSASFLLVGLLLLGLCLRAVVRRLRQKTEKQGE